MQRLMDGLSFVDPQVLGQAFRRPAGYSGRAINRAVAKGDLNFCVAVGHACSVSLWISQRYLIMTGLSMSDDGNGDLRRLPFRQRHQINDDVSHLRELRRLRHEE